MLQITSFHSPVSKFPYLQGRRLRERGAAIYRKEARCLGPYLYRECPLISLRPEIVKLSTACASRMIIECEGASNGEDYDMSTRNFLTRLNTKLDSSPPQQDLSERCIYKVPKLLRNVKPEAYTPQLISIGPLHHDDAKLEIMQRKKLICFREFKRNRLSDERIMDLVNIIRNNEKKIRQYYSKNFDEIESMDFIEMILLDAVFIIEFIRESNVSEDGPKNLEPWMMSDIEEDLKLLENQLPFFIIQEIYDEVNRGSQEYIRIPFLHLTAFYLGKEEFPEVVRHIRIPFLLLATFHFGNFQGFSDFMRLNKDPKVKGSRHFTDLLRNLMLNGVIKRRFTFGTIKLKYSAVMLRKAGVRFRIAKDQKCLLNIKFEKGVLEIPRLEVDYRFERFVRNIMALEQCYKPNKAYMCNYIRFMDNLINSAEDVDLLVENGIIHHWPGDNAALSNMFNKLNENIGDNSSTCYDDICENMNGHYEYRWNHVKANLRHVYFPTVWRGTATVAAAILLVLTFIQTITSVKSVF